MRRWSLGLAVLLVASLTAAPGALAEKQSAEVRLDTAGSPALEVVAAGDLADDQIALDTTSLVTPPGEARAEQGSQLHVALADDGGNATLRVTGDLVDRTVEVAVPPSPPSPPSTPGVPDVSICIPTTGGAPICVTLK